MHMTSSFNAKIEIDAEEKTSAVFDSVNIDNKFYPENPTKTEMFCSDKITILVESNNLAHMRANLNSCIRLVQTGYDSIESVDI
jgi:KEOPS complex subunit Pcc1